MVFPSHTGHVTTETVFGQALALWLEKRDERRPLESDTTGLKMSRGTFTFNKEGTSIPNHREGL